MYETTESIDQTATLDQGEQMSTTDLATSAASVRETGSWHPASAAYATDHLFAVVDDSRAVTPALANLRAQGFSQNDVRVYSGQVHARILEQQERTRLLTRFFRAVQEAFTYDEHTSRQRYVRALRQGKTVVMVHCPSDERMQAARDVLASAGAREMVYYGRWNIQLVGSTQTMTTGEPRLPRSPRVLR